MPVPAVRVTNLAVIPNRRFFDVRRSLLDAAAARRDYGVATVDNVVDPHAARLLRSAQRCVTDGVGQERAAWDDVFAPQPFDQLADVLGAPRGRRQPARRVLYAKAQAHLPASFSDLPADISTHEVACGTFELGIVGVG
jgi:hypothetical protein